MAANRSICRISLAQRVAVHHVSYLTGHGRRRFLRRLDQPDQRRAPISQRLRILNR
jgi:hypothetical protein